MSAPSTWPLNSAAIRFLTPAFMVEIMARHPLTQECYPTAMGFYPEATGHHMERDRHDDNLLIYCTDGRGRLVTDAGSGDVAAGQVMLLPEGTTHRYEADRKHPWTLFWVHFQGAASAFFLQHLGYRGERPIVDAGVSPMLVSAFSSLMEVRRTGYSTRSFINASNQLRHLLSQIALEISAEQGRRESAFDLSTIQAYMLEHIDQPLSLEQMAARANMSKFHFSKRYKLMTGYSPVKHFLNMKMEAACKVLDSTDASVKQVAAQLGYDDPLYFSRRFQRTVGLSPTQYRVSSRR